MDKQFQDENNEFETSHAGCFADSRRTINVDAVSSRSGDHDARFCAVGENHARRRHCAGDDEAGKTG